MQALEHPQQNQQLKYLEKGNDSCLLSPSRAYLSSARGGAVVLQLLKLTTLPELQRAASAGVSFGDAEQITAEIQK